MRGYTLVEVMVVIAIIVILTLAGAINVTEFQKNALLDSEANEFASALQTARAKSMTGEISKRLTGMPDNIEGIDYADYRMQYSDYNPADLPVYSIQVTGSQYQLLVEYTLAGGDPLTDRQREILQTTAIDPRFTLTAGTSLFERRTGKTNPITYTLDKTGTTEGREIVIDSQGTIEVVRK